MRIYERFPLRPSRIFCHEWLGSLENNIIHRICVGVKHASPVSAIHQGAGGRPQGSRLQGISTSKIFSVVPNQRIKSGKIAGVKRCFFFLRVVKRRSKRPQGLDYKSGAYSFYNYNLPGALWLPSWGTIISKAVSKLSCTSTKHNNNVDIINIFAIGSKCNSFSIY